MSKLVVLKLEPMFACMSMTNMEMLHKALRTAQPVWQCRLEHIRACTTVMICRSPMSNELVGMENDSGRGMMMVRPLRDYDYRTKRIHVL